MQNDYAGPLADFAMVVPVPVVLREGEVKTLPKDVFRRIDQLGAPRLVEYWEQNPCPVDRTTTKPMPTKRSMAYGAARGESAAMDKDSGVTIEAQFDVAEYKIVNIISSDKRYEVANYKNAFIPTNFDVKNSVRERFGEFYAALFDKTIEANPRTVITEYAWKALPRLKCDPCPPQPPIDADMLTLGGDVIGGPIAKGTYTLTRLHARYGKADMTDDLRFREASPVTGGRESWTAKGLEYGAAPATENAFQARYAIRHWWTGPITCKNPRRGVWGGPPDGGRPQPIAASQLAYAPRGKLRVSGVIGRDLWEIGLKKDRPAAPPPPKAPAPTTPAPKGAMGFGAGVCAGLAFFAVQALRNRRRARREARTLDT